MKKIFSSFIFCLVLFACGDDQCTISENADLFDEFWESFDPEYAAFEILNKDWDEVRSQ